MKFRSIRDCTQVMRARDFWASDAKQWAALAAAIEFLVLLINDGRDIDRDLTEFMPPAAGLPPKEG